MIRKLLVAFAYSALLVLPFAVIPKTSVAGPAIAEKVIAQHGMVNTAREGNEKSKKIANVMDFGAMGNCIADDTLAIQAALTAADYVRLPKPPVCYKVTSINVGANKTILTDGFGTVVKQIAGQPIGSRTIRVTGSNVRIDSLKVYGNIATDKNEQQHAIFVQANMATGNIENVTLGDIIGQDIRGDVLYIGQTTGYAVRNVRAGNVSGDNIYRNIVTFISGTGLTINSITGSRVGLTHFDVEPNLGSGVAKNINIRYIKGRTVGLIGPSAADFVDAVNIETIDIDPAYAAQSSPPYPSGLKIEDGLILRNLKHARIGNLYVNGFNRSAMFTITNKGELGVERIIIGHAEITNCALTDKVYKSYFYLNATYLVLESLKVDINGDRRIFSNGGIGGKIANVTAHVGPGAIFLYSSSNFIVTDISLTGNGTFIKGGGGHTIINGTIDGSRLSASAAPNTFMRVKATMSDYLFDGNDSEHLVKDSVLDVQR